MLYLVKNQFGIIVLADYYSIFIMNMALRGGGGDDSKFYATPAGRPAGVHQEQGEGYGAVSQCADTQGPVGLFRQIKKPSRAERRDYG